MSFCGSVHLINPLEHFPSPKCFSSFSKSMCGMFLTIMKLTMSVWIVISVRKQCTFKRQVTHNLYKVYRHKTSFFFLDATIYRICFQPFNSLALVFNLHGNFVPSCIIKIGCLSSCRSKDINQIRDLAMLFVLKKVAIHVGNIPMCFDYYP